MLFYIQNANGCAFYLLSNNLNMSIFNEKEIDLAESFLDDLTGLLITTYKISSEEVRSGNSFLVMHRESDARESISNIEYLEIADLTLLFLNVFFTMKDNEADIVINDRKVKILAEINDLNGNLHLRFIAQK